jgi:hypothetical protein
MKRMISILCAVIMTATLFLPIDQPAMAETPKQVTYPTSGTVTYGTDSGQIPDDVTAQDGRTYSVAEEDTNTGRSYTNDTLNPNGIGSNTEMNANHATCTEGIPQKNYLCVDEGGPSPGDENTTYVFTVIPLEETWANDTYATEDYTLASGYSVDEVRIYGTALEVADGNPGYALCVYSGTTLDCGSLETLTEEYTEYTNTWTTDPDTSVAWTDSGIDALEGGHRIYWDGVVGGTEKRSTLLYGVVQSSTALDDFTVSFDFLFTNIGLRQKPKLQIDCSRTGDTEGISILVSRSGSWVTLSNDVCDTTLTHTEFSLSTTDVLGGSATIRILDTDTTDDSQSTVNVDRIAIVTEGEGDNPMSSIQVYTASEYLMWENRLKVSLWWEQTGGPETANAISKWLKVTIDGDVIHKGYIQVDDGFVYVPVTWNALDGGFHQIEVQGNVLINWTSGSTIYQSDVEKLVADNFWRWVFLVAIFLIIMSVVVYFVLRYLAERREYIERYKETEQ